MKRPRCPGRTGLVVVPCLREDRLRRVLKLRNLNSTCGAGVWSEGTEDPSGNQTPSAAHPLWLPGPHDSGLRSGCFLSNDEWVTSAYPETRREVGPGWGEDTAARAKPLGQNSFIHSLFQGSVGRGSPKLCPAPGSYLLYTRRAASVGGCYHVPPPAWPRGQDVPSGPGPGTRTRSRRSVFSCARPCWSGKRV